MIHQCADTPVSLPADGKRPDMISRPGTAPGS